MALAIQLTRLDLALQDSLALRIMQEFKTVSSLLLATKLSKIYFFLRPTRPLPFWSLNSWCDLDKFWTCLIFLKNQFGCNKIGNVMQISISGTIGFFLSFIILKSLVSLLICKNPSNVMIQKKTHLTIFLKLERCNCSESTPLVITK